MYVCVCLFQCVHTHTHAHTHTHTHTRTHTHRHTCIHTHTVTHIQSHTYIHWATHRHRRTHARIHTQSHKHTYTQSHTHTHIYIHTHLLLPVSILLYGCTTWTLTKRLEKKLDGNYTRMLRAILNKSWRQHPTRRQLYGHLPPITKTIQVRRARHAGHCWRSKDELVSDVLLWAPHMAKQKQDDQPELTYSSYVRTQDVTQKTCRRRWMIGRSGERVSRISVLVARYDDDDIYIYIYICLKSKKSTKVSPNWIIRLILTKERFDQNFISLIKKPLERIKLALKAK